MVRTLIACEGVLSHGRQTVAKMLAAELRSLEETGHRIIAVVPCPSEAGEHPFVIVTEAK